MTITITEASAAVSAIGLVSGLVGAYVGVQNRALLAEVRKEMAELENRVVARINGTFVRKEVCDLLHERRADD